MCICVWKQNIKKIKVQNIKKIKDQILRRSKCKDALLLGSNIQLYLISTHGPDEARMNK